MHAVATQLGPTPGFADQIEFIFHEMTRKPKRASPGADDHMAPSEHP